MFSIKISYLQSTDDRESFIFVCMIVRYNQNECRNIWRMFEKRKSITRATKKVIFYKKLTFRVWFREYFRTIQEIQNSSQSKKMHKFLVILQLTIGFVFSQMESVKNINFLKNELFTQSVKIILWYFVINCTSDPPSVETLITPDRPKSWKTV